MVGQMGDERRLVHELEVQRVALDIQNEGLGGARLETRAALERYVFALRLRALRLRAPAPDEPARPATRRAGRPPRAKIRTGSRRASPGRHPRRAARATATAHDEGADEDGRWVVLNDATCLRSPSALIRAELPRPSWPLGASRVDLVEERRDRRDAVALRGHGAITVLPSRCTAVWANNRPLIVAPVCNVAAVWVNTMPSPWDVVPKSTSPALSRC